MFSFFLTIMVYLFSPSTSWACASCGCTLSSNWEVTDQKEFQFDLRYDFINQNQLRSGTSTLSSTSASQMSNNGNNQEVELYTKTIYVTAMAQYTVNSDWKVNLVLPYVIRHHSTLGTASDGTSGGAGGGQYTSNTSSLGDAKILGRFQGFATSRNLGLIFGLKFPTGSHSLTGTSTDPTSPGPVTIDRGLQPGTGTTDVILGATYSEAMSKNWDYFGEGLYQSALNSSDQYRPGDGLNLNLGLRYMGLEKVTPQIQINSRIVHHDTGVNSDTISTGGTLIYLSPGLLAHLSETWETYTFVQVPIYQNLLGVQLAPNYTASLGARYSF